MCDGKGARKCDPMNNIKQIRKSMGISVTELAQKLHMSQGNLTKIENGQVDLRLDTARAIAEALECPLERIMGREKAESSPLVVNLNLPQGSLTMKITTDTMSPTLQKGEIAVIQPQSTKNDDGVYFIEKDGREQIRRIQTLSYEKVALIYDNKAYETEYADIKDIKIKGKVIQKISVTTI